MPLIQIHASAQPIAKEAEKALLAKASRALADVTGKPESYAMVTFSRVSASMAGNADAPAAFVDVRGIGGLSRDVNAKLARAIGDLLRDSLGIAPSRTYLTFTDVAAANWGWNGETFG